MFHTPIFNQVKQRFTCTSSSLIYCVQCLQCCKLYIEETKQICAAPAFSSKM